MNHQPRRASLSALATLTLSLWLAADCAAAPAPLPVRERYHGTHVPRRCVLHWHGSDYRALFLGDGSYHAWDASAHWHGGWRRFGSRVYVEEWHGERRGQPFRWSCELGGTGPVRLEPR